MAVCSTPLTTHPHKLLITAKSLVQWLERTTNFAYNKIEGDEFLLTDWWSQQPLRIDETLILQCRFGGFTILYKCKKV